MEKEIKSARKRIRTHLKAREFKEALSVCQVSTLVTRGGAALGVQNFRKYKQEQFCNHSKIVQGKSGVWCQKYFDPHLTHICPFQCKTPKI